MKSIVKGEKMFESIVLHYTATIGIHNKTDYCVRKWIRGGGKMIGL